MQNNERVGRKIIRSFSLLKDESLIKTNGKKSGLKDLWNKLKNKTPLNEKKIHLSDSATTLTTEEHAKPIFVKKPALSQHKSDGDLKKLASLLRPRSMKKEADNHPPSWSEGNTLPSLNYGKNGDLIYVSENGKYVMVMQIFSPKRLEAIAGTLDRLFLKLVDDINQDQNYADTFILCHSFFISSCDLLKKLLSFFQQKVLPGEQLREWQKRLQIKVLNVILHWIMLQFDDFNNNPDLLVQLETLFKNYSSQKDYENQISSIKELLKKKLLQMYKQAHAKVVDLSLESIDYEIYDPLQYAICNNISDFYSSSFLNIHSGDIAKQLTMADFALLKNVKFWDYINYEHGHEKKKHYVLSISERANSLSRWVTHKINENTESQNQVVHKMIDIAKICLEWNNFHTAMVITMALDQSESTQNILSDPIQEATYRKLSKYLDLSHNMSYYRTALNNAHSPCVPFFPLVLKDITFLLEGCTSTYQQQPGLIHFNKFRQIKEVIYSIINLTSENYTFLK
ncbi:ras guanine nucleotide exchange factor domain-containing protein [Sporodiniella umbellata]|nr:ras guanine nucleotide exchange factor domain-containing protein [Sporodiniella umbellata]